MQHRIVKYLNAPILERPADPVTEFDTPELHAFVESMFETMYASHGVGLAVTVIFVAARQRAALAAAHAQSDPGSVAVRW